MTKHKREVTVTNTNKTNVPFPIRFAAAALGIMRVCISTSILILTYFIMVELS